MNTYSRSIFVALGLLSLCFAVPTASNAAPAGKPCNQVRTACEQAGFTQGGKGGSGLMADCVAPIMQGVQPANASKPLPAVNPATVAACKADNPTFGQAKNGGTQKAAKNTPRSVAPQSRPRFTPADGGLTIHDEVLHVTWLVDANFPQKESFGQQVNKDGSMTYTAALAWVGQLNAGAGYLGHKTWTLPTIPAHDPSCTTTGPKPQHDKFAYNCVNGSFGSLYYDAANLHIPKNETAVPIPPNQIGFFKNFQPYLYWSGTAGGKNKNGYSTFSFNSGWQGQNVAQHYMYVLPMIKGNPFAASAKGKALQPVAKGEAVYDPVTDITWAANANLAATGVVRISGLNKDGAMQQQTACAFVRALNGANGGTPYLGQKNWEVPTATQDSHDISCAPQLDSESQAMWQFQLHGQPDG